MPAQEAEDRQQIRLAGDAAYAELERVVSRLVQLPRSRDEVSEQDSSLLDLVNKAIDEFKKLSATSQLNTFQLGTAMGDCESVRTGLRQHMDKMKAQCDTWNMESQSAWESSEGHRRSKDDYAGKQADFDDRARSTADEMTVSPIVYNILIKPSLFMLTPPLTEHWRRLLLSLQRRLGASSEHSPG